MRLIDADALNDELIRGVEADTDKSVQTTFTKSVCMILCKAIEKQPTVDAVPVIRCNDCRWFSYSYHGMQRLCRKGNINIVFANGYCSLAERKEHETD